MLLASGRLLGCGRPVLTVGLQADGVRVCSCAGIALSPQLVSGFIVVDEILTDLLNAPQSATGERKRKEGKKKRKKESKEGRKERKKGEKEIK